MQLRAMLLALAAGAALSCGPAAAQTQASMRVRGEITAVDTTALTVRLRTGEVVKIALRPDQVVGSVKQLALGDIRPGSFVGTATRTTPSGELVALEVLVFPEAARGTGEGHYAWDLAPGSMMTNATVDAVVEGVQGRVMKLSYKGGSKDVTVPDGVPVVTPAAAALADLAVGRKVFAFAQGEPPNLSAARIYVEKDGVAPPM